MNKNKLYYVVLTAGLVLIVAGLIRKENIDSDIVDLGDFEVEDQEMLDEDNNSEQENVVKNYLEGVLYRSEDTNGNLKLSSNEGEIYIRTSRDYSALIGFEVLVLIDGDKDNFELVDIQSRVAKDGFIRQQ